VIAAIVTHPFDVLKTRLQVASTHTAATTTHTHITRETVAAAVTTGETGALNVCCAMAECCCPCTGRPLTETSSPPAGAGAGAGPVRPAVRRGVGVREGLMEIVQTRGLRGLYTGLTMRLATIVPGSGIMITVYEFAKSLDM
jgi:hypothetical protein